MKSLLLPALHTAGVQPSVCIATHKLPWLHLIKAWHACSAHRRPSTSCQPMAFFVVPITLLAHAISPAGNHLDKDHLGCRLAISADGSSLALAAARGRVACLAVTATADGVQLSEPAVYAPAAAGVAGAVEYERGRQQRLELGSIVDLAFCSSSSSSGVQHLAAISYRCAMSAQRVLAHAIGFCSCTWPAC
jgi:hypothetical protein